MTVYEQVKKKSLPLLEAYHFDLLEVDRDLIRSWPNEEFLHWTGRNGTTLVINLKASNKRRNLDFVKSMINTTRNRLLLHFDGKKLKEIPLQEAVSVAQAWIDDCEVIPTVKLIPATYEWECPSCGWIYKAYIASKSVSCKVPTCRMKFQVSNYQSYKKFN